MLRKIFEQIAKAAVLLAFCAAPAYAQIDRAALEKLHAALADALDSRTITVSTTDELKAAVADARAGDTIIAPASLHDVILTLPKFDGDRPATLKVSGALPEAEMSPADWFRMLTVRGVEVAKGAHHWKLDGVRIAPTRNTYGAFKCGSDTGYASVAEIPHHIEFDRSIVDIAEDVQNRRGIQGNCAFLTLRRGGVWGAKEDRATATEAQGFAAWDTPGPFLIEDFTFEGSGENFIIGGADPSIQGMTPTDITLRNVKLVKPLAWKGGKWNVKNSFELKHARKVRVYNLLIDGVWVDGQAGYAMVLTPRNQDGNCRWCLVDDVIIDGLVVRNAASGVVIQGTDDEKPSGRLTNVTIRNGLWLLDKATFGGEGRPCMLLAGPSGITFDHNTFIADGASICNIDGPKVTGFVWTNNIAKHGLYGFIGTGTAPGMPSIEAFFDKPIILKNVFAGAGITYPATNLRPSIATFLNQFNADWVLKPTSSWKNAGTDGKDLGVFLHLSPR